MNNSDAKANKARILESSIALFYEHGFAKASTRDIAKHAGVTLSTTYNHFKNKDDLLYQIVMDIGTALSDSFDEATEGLPNGKEALAAMVTAQLCLIEQRSKEIKIYLEEQYQLPPDLRKPVLAQHRSVYDRYYEQVKAIEEQGLLNDIDKTVATFSIIAMINWAYRWYREGSGLTMEDISKEILKFCFNGILKPQKKREKK